MRFNEKLNTLDDEELKDSANLQFGETPELLESSLQELHSWISKSPHLQDIQQDDKILKMFLRGCKLSLERTKEKLDMYHSAKGFLPEWFDNWNPFDPVLQSQLQKPLLGLASMHNPRIGPGRIFGHITSCPIIK